MKTLNFIVGVIGGTGLGALIATLFVGTSWYVFACAFFALIGLVTMGVLTVAIIVDVKNEEAQKTSQPSNWGWDKRLEQ